MRALSLRQAQNCENAKCPQCKCRCKGAAHGRRLVMETAVRAREEYELLPKTDPHHLPTKEEIAEKRREARRQFGIMQYGA